MPKHFDIPREKIRNSELEYMHVSELDEEEPVGGWTGTAFIILLAAVIFAFIIHLA